jgi:uncharacterized membrane protein
MAIFGKLAFDDGATAGTLLAARFAIAAIALWCVVLIKGLVPQIRALAGRDVRIALGLGGCGYAFQAGCYFVALEHLDASLLSLILYTFPAIVTVAAVALGREVPRPPPRDCTRPRVDRAGDDPRHSRRHEHQRSRRRAGGLARRSPTATTSWSATASRAACPRSPSPRSCAPAQPSRSRSTRPSPWTAPPRRRHARRVGLARLPRHRLDSRSHHTVLRGTESGRADERLDPFDF